MKISLKILSVFTAIVLMFSALSFSSFAQSKEDLESELERIEKEIEEYQKKIDALKNDAASQEDYINELNKQIKAYDDQLSILNEQINQLNAKISGLNAQIAEFEKKISALEDDIAKIDAQIADQNVKIDETYEILKKRLRAAYMAGGTSELEIFLDATDFQDFLTRSELVRQVSKHDAAVISSLQNQIKDLKDMEEKLHSSRTELEDSKNKIVQDRAEIEVTRQSVQSSKSALDKKQAQVEAKLNQVNEIVGNLNQQSKEYQRLLEKSEKEKAAISKALDEWVHNNGSQGSGSVDNGDVHHNFRVSSKGLICPLQDGAVGYSANFASHSSRGSAAVDFTAPKNRVVNGKTYYTTKGAKIYAAASGKVILATYQASGYGYYVIIDHGNGLSTLYAHCDTLYVKVGDTVKQGQAVAAAGNTGNCLPAPTPSNPVAGSHLHFEVRVNGVRKNPELYMPSPLI